MIQGLKSKRITPELQHELLKELTFISCMIEHPTQENVYLGGDIAVLKAFDRLHETGVDMKKYLTFYTLFEKTKSPDERGIG